MPGGGGPGRENSQRKGLGPRVCLMAKQQSEAQWLGGRGGARGGLGSYLREMEPQEAVSRTGAGGPEEEDA